MNPLAQMEVVRAIYDDRRRVAEQSRRAASVRHRLNPSTAQLVIRTACGRRDARKLERLAALDSAPTPAGPTLVAEMDGQLVAALPLSGTAQAVADPFVPTAPVVELLRLRAAQLRPAA